MSAREDLTGSGSRWRPAIMRRVDPAVATAFGCIVVLLLLGSLYSTSFLSPEYLLQQLQVGAFLAMMATGMMIVILLGQIDLSVPWAVTVGGMMSTAAAGHGAAGAALAIPFGVLCGLALGLGERLRRRLSARALDDLHARRQCGRAGPDDPAHRRLGPAGHGDARRCASSRPAIVVAGMPNAVWIWLVVGAATVFLLNRTTFGRAVYGIGNREQAAYLSGIRTQRVVLIAFMLSGGLSAFAGALLAGYSTKAYQGMGDPYLLPAIAAVVLGGTSILGGRGSYLGTTAGVILITLLQSILSVMQIADAGRQVIYGVVILAMLLLYGRSAKIGA